MLQNNKNFATLFLIIAATASVLSVHQPSQTQRIYAVNRNNFNTAEFASMRPGGEIPGRPQVSPPTLSTEASAAKPVSKATFTAKEVPSYESCATELDGVYQLLHSFSKPSPSNNLNCIYVLKNAFNGSSKVTDNDYKTLKDLIATGYGLSADKDLQSEGSGCISCLDINSTRMAAQKLTQVAAELAFKKVKGDLAKSSDDKDTKRDLELCLKTKTAKECEKEETSASAANAKKLWAQIKRECQKSSKEDYDDDSLSCYTDALEEVNAANLRSKHKAAILNEILEETGDDFKTALSGKPTSAAYKIAVSLGKEIAASSKGKDGKNVRDTLSGYVEEATQSRIEAQIASITAENEELAANGLLPNPAYVTTAGRNVVGAILKQQANTAKSIFGSNSFSLRSGFGARLRTCYTELSKTIDISNFGCNFQSSDTDLALGTKPTSATVTARGTRSGLTTLGVGTNSLQPITVKTANSSGSGVSGVPAVGTTGFGTRNTTLQNQGISGVGQQNLQLATPGMPTRQ